MSQLAIKYSVVIVSYNCKESLKECLQSLKKNQIPGTQIIVFDNNSSDNTQSLTPEFPEVEFIFSPVNEGFSKGCNLGSASAKGEYLVFLNPDTMVTPHWLSHLEVHFQHQNTGAVGPVSNYVAGLQKYEAYCAERLASKHDIDSLAQKIYPLNRGRGVSTSLLIGFCLMIKKDLFMELGKMDEDLFLGNDDLDLSWRLKCQGYNLVVATDTFIYHEGQKSFQTEPNAKVTRLVEESTNALYKKLVKYYGDEKKVPAPEKLWGIGWFNPTIKGTLPLSALEEKPKLQKKMNYTWIIYVGPRDNFNSLEQTLKSIPEEFHPDVIVTNQSGNGNAPFEGFSGTKLDFNSKISPVRALKKTLKLAEFEQVIFIKTGSLFTGIFLQSLNNSNIFSDHPLKIQSKDLQDEKPFLSGCIGGRSSLEAWLSENIEQVNLFALLDEKLQSSEELPVLQYATSEDPDPFSKYPDALTKHMQEFKSIGFTGDHSTAVFTPDGKTTDISTRDLIIYRLESTEADKVEKALDTIQSRATLHKKLLLLTLNLPKTTETTERDQLLSIREAIWKKGYYLDTIETFEETNKTGKNAEEYVSNGFQFVCRKRPAEYALDKLVSIIILGYNQVEFTKNCIESIQQNTKQNYELILIDNGSDDGTAEYFHSIKGATVIINPENLGVARGWNQGLKKAKGDYLLIFNNDTLVMPVALENLVRLAECSPETGIVGPRSNNISGPQIIKNLELKTMAEISTFAQNWQQQNDLSAMEFERVTGFCMLIPRKVFNDVGYFDERYGKGNFEDDDYCLRVRYSGYKLLIAHDSFIFHFGSVSFSSDSVDWQQLMQENQHKFQEKWKHGKAALKDTHLEENENSIIQTLVAKATQAYTLGDFEEAQSYYLQASEIEEHSEVYNGLGILQFHQNNFEDALKFFQKALSLNPKDDDISNNIIDLIEKCCSAEVGLQVLDALLVKFPDNKVFLSSVQNKVSLKTNSESPWKTQVEEFITAKRYPEATALIEGIIKSENDLSLCYNYLGIIAFETENPEKAWEYFEKSIQINMFYEDALVNYCDAGIVLNKKSDVLGMLEKVFSYPEKSNDLSEIKQIYHQLKLESTSGSWNADKIIASRENNIQGENLIREGLMEKAKALFEKIIEQDPQNFRAHNNMGLVHWYAHDFEPARDWFDKSIELNPTYVDALVNLFDASLKTNSIDAFRPRLDKVLQLEPQCREATEMLNLILDKKSDVYDILNYESMDSVNAQVQEGDALLKAGKMNDATLKYIDSIETNPENYMAYNGLGIIAYKRKMYEDAHRLFDTAIQLNPLDKDSLLNLWENSKFISREKAAIQRLVAALEIDPTLSEIKTIVDSYTGQ